MVASILFSLYVSRFVDHNATCGSIGAVIVLLKWLFITTFVVLLGAQPLGHRGAYVADHLPVDPQ